ncbi:DUF433 domain-containing protein [Phaeobacter inhibens]|uniref:DUF433 domain-containing protein n=1 Tax=Phaeobacter inhibens TaxID=221822 RepID=UPI0001632F9B|nr:DUF433 domain-containing protein [Phaeobacter inhibens]AFO92743.1 hypothetical protein PGA1_c30940 [Phaeobacter inhibens DSM 17395]AUQ47446.1 hypothetical protein PhaeoP10_03142 [Phaeobacter inhibens]AXT24050.1 DUF433 domain-containing protein [Phaeobacter inhibens]
MTPELITFADLPKAILRPLTIDEVAAIVGAKREKITRQINTGAVPKSALSRAVEQERQGAQSLLKPVACPMALFDLTTGHLLSTQMRRRMVREIANIVSGKSTTWVVEEGTLRIDLSKPIESAIRKMAALAQAEAIVVADPDIRGGMPVLRGTRIGVYEIADISKHETEHWLLKNFPSMTVERLQQAMLYAKAHPLHRLK